VTEEWGCDDVEAQMVYKVTAWSATATSFSFFLFFFKQNQNTVTVEMGGCLSVSHSDQFFIEVRFLFRAHGLLLGLS